MYQDFTPLLEIIEGLVKELGAKNVTGEAIYDAALQYKIDTASTYWQGFSPWAFSQTTQYLPDSFKMYEWSGAEKDLVAASERIAYT